MEQWLTNANIALTSKVNKMINEVILMSVGSMGNYKYLISVKMKMKKCINR